MKQFTFPKIIQTFPKWGVPSDTFHLFNDYVTTECHKFNFENVNNLKIYIPKGLGFSIAHILQDNPGFKLCRDHTKADIILISTLNYQQECYNLYKIKDDEYIRCSVYNAHNFIDKVNVNNLIYTLGYIIKAEYKNLLTCFNTYSPNKLCDINYFIQYFSNTLSSDNINTILSLLESNDINSRKMGLFYLTQSNIYLYIDKLIPILQSNSFRDIPLPQPIIKFITQYDLQCFTKFKGIPANRSNIYEWYTKHNENISTDIKQGIIKNITDFIFNYLEQRMIYPIMDDYPCKIIFTIDNYSYEYKFKRGTIGSFKFSLKNIVAHPYINFMDALPSIFTLCSVKGQKTLETWYKLSVEKFINQHMNYEYKANSNIKVKIIWEK